MTIPRLIERSADGAERVTERSSVYRVQVLDRILQILDILSDANVELGPAELAVRLSLHKSTVHRLLMELERHRLVRRSASHGKYGLGIKLFELGVRAAARFDVQQRTEPQLRRLVETTGETAHVSVLDGTEAVSVAMVEGPWTLRTPSTIGKRSPVYCTSIGKALIAFLPEPYLENLLRRLKFVPHTPNTLRTRTALRAELARVRERGYAVDNEEVEVGLRCVGAPIRDSTGTVVASISIAGPIFRVTEQRLPAIARIVIASAQALSEDVGQIVGKPQVMKTETVTGGPPGSRRKTESSQHLTARRTP